MARMSTQAHLSSRRDKALLVVHNVSLRLSTSQATLGHRWKRYLRVSYVAKGYAHRIFNYVFTKYRNIGMR
jgi:hypothetical protein